MGMLEFLVRKKRKRSRKSVVVQVKSSITKHKTKQDGDWSSAVLAKGALREAVGGRGIRRNQDDVLINSQTRTHRVAGRSGSISVPESVVLSRNNYQAQFAASTQSKVVKVHEKPDESEKKVEKKADKEDKFEMKNKKKSLRGSAVVANVSRDLYHASKSRKSVLPSSWKKQNSFWK